MAKSQPHGAYDVLTPKSLKTRAPSFNPDSPERIRSPAGFQIRNVLVQVDSVETQSGASLIVERVRAGMRNARSEGKHVGRPRRSLDSQNRSMLAEGLA